MDAASPQVYNAGNRAVSISWRCILSSAGAVAWAAKESSTLPLPKGPPVIALLKGSDGVRTIDWGFSRISHKGNNDVHRVLEFSGFAWRRIHISPSYFRQSGRWNLDRYAIIFNSISDPDQAPATLAVAQKMLRGLSIPVINRPEEIVKTTREGMARQLSGIENVIVPQTIRIRNSTADRVKMLIERSGASFPVIVRAAGTHAGNIMGVFDDAVALEPIFGNRRGEYILTPFVPYKSSDGLHRKYRVWFIGQEMILQHMLISDQWIVHNSERTRFMAARDDLRSEERRVLERGIGGFPQQVQRALAQIRARVNLEYFGLDFATVEEASILVFEANAQMHFVGNTNDDGRFDYVKMCKEPTISAISKLIQNATRSA
jgi:glutathione synthase/RimK-type ligase-like ATP-grasp enzyme